jgi:hypothetical protein
MFVSLSMIHLSRGNRPLARCPNQLWGGEPGKSSVEAAAEAGVSNTVVRRVVARET